MAALQKRKHIERVLQDVLLITDESNGNPQQKELKRRESIGLFRIPCAGEESDNDSLYENLSCHRKNN